MPGSVLYAINPTRRLRRKTHVKRKTHRSAAQKAATRRMIAARFGRNPSKRRRARPAAAPAVVHRRRSSRRSARRVARRSSGGGGIRTGVMSLLKAGAIGGAGAVAVDVVMGYAKNVLPATMQSPVDSAGGMNLGYFGVKGALAVALGLYGRRVMPAAIAGQMAEGALTVLAYTILRPMVPTTISLGYMNPAPTMRPNVGNAGRYVSGMGVYNQIGTGTRSAAPSGKGAQASQILSMVNNRRVA